MGRFVEFEYNKYNIRVFKLDQGIYPVSVDSQGMRMIKAMSSRKGGYTILYQVKMSGSPQINDTTVHPDPTEET